MISKRILGWQAREETPEVSQQNEFSNSLCNFELSLFDATSSPSVEEKVYVLSILNEGSRFASDCQKNVWEFAVELSDLLDRGISRSLLRWLVCHGLVEHRIESYVTKADHRQFFEAPNLAFGEQSSFVLSKKGQQAFQELINNYRPMITKTPNRVHFDSPTTMNQLPKETPTWCPRTRVLKFAGKVVKHFKWPAPNQEILIAAFDEMGWPDQIDDPLPQTDVCPKRRLHDTIKCLNRKQINPVIKFRGDGTGCAARWEIMNSSNDTNNSA